VADIDVTSIVLNGEIPAFPKPAAIGDYDGDGISDLMVKFSRSGVQNLLVPGDEVEVNVTGQLYDGILFESRDVIGVKGH